MSNRRRRSSCEMAAGQDNCGDPLDARRLSLSDCREILGDSCLGNEELLRLRDQLYALADVTVENWRGGKSTCG